MTANGGNDHEHRLLELLSGKWVTAAISAAAELGLADVLAAGPMELSELARKLECDSSALLRLLRVLGGEGLVEIDPQGRCSITEVGAQLRQDKLRDLARFVGSPFVWSPWASLPSALRSDVSAFEAIHGASLFDYLDSHPTEAHLYHSAVDAFTRREAHALIDAFDFSQVGTIVDVGGGLGTLLSELAERWPTMRCILFDRPAVVEQARASFANTPLAHRIEAIGGDFFTSVPSGADAYVVKHVVHNWGDDQAIEVLQRCASALRPGGHVLIVESILLPGHRRDGTPLLDLEMLVLCGAGRERSKPEFRTLLRRAGLKLVSTRDLAGMARLLVAAPL
ncbi:MAG TPA: methyltransferase [Polyangiales bacterium]|jgi:SAM-dependent methyltransferase|nr:methyltransferase [Polyangiales bacterium]